MQANRAFRIGKRTNDISAYQCILVAHAVYIFSMMIPILLNKIYHLHNKLHIYFKLYSLYKLIISFSLFFFFYIWKFVLYWGNLFQMNFTIFLSEYILIKQSSKIVNNKKHFFLFFLNINIEYCNIQLITLSKYFIIYIINYLWTKKNILFIFSVK